MKTILGFSIGLITGIIGTWLVVSSVQNSSTVNETDSKNTTASKAQSTTRHSRTGTTRESRARSSALEKTYAEIRKHYGDKADQKVSALSETDVQQLIKLALGKTDLTDGLDYQDDDLLECALLSLASRDLNAALTWIDQSFTGPTRESMLKIIAHKHFKDKPLEAIAFAEAHMKEGGASEVAGRFLTSTKALSTATAVQLLSHIQLQSSYGGSNSDFAEDFDFKTFAETALKITEENGEGKFATFPTNLLEEWVKKNPTEAINFYNDHLMGKDYPLPFNGFSDLVEAYIAITPAKEASSWLAETLQPGNIPTEERKDLIKSMLRDNGTSRSILSSAVQQMNLSPGEVLKFYTTFNNWGGTSSIGARFAALQLFPDAATRMQAFERAYTKRNRLKISDKQFAELSQQLHRLGHDNQDIKRLENLRTKSRTKGK